MGAVSIERHGGFKSPLNRLEFFFKKTHDRVTIAPRSGHDHASIGPRSSRDRATIVILILHWTPFDDRGDDFVMKDPQSRLDRASIGPRSWSSSRIVLAVRWRSQLDEDPTRQRAPRVTIGCRSDVPERTTRRQDEMKIERS